MPDGLSPPPTSLEDRQPKQPEGQQQQPRATQPPDGLGGLDTTQSNVIPPEPPEPDWPTKILSLPPECELILDADWIAHAPLPQSGRSPRALYRSLDTLRLLHQLDKQTWDDVGLICRYAAMVWVPQGMIGAPSSLREWTGKKDRRVWEAILSQARAQTARRNGQPPQPDTYVLDQAWREQVEAEP